MNLVLVGFFLMSPVISTLVSGGEEAYLSVTLYKHQNKQGPSMTMDIRGCKNVPLEWNDKTASLALVGRCIRLYKDQDCTGRMMKIYPENRLWMYDLKRVHFSNMISSISSCRPESATLETGRYAIESPMDRRVLTVRRLISGYTMLKTLRWRKDLTQQWDVEKNEDNTYLLTPRMFQNNAMTYNIDPAQKRPPERVDWLIEALHNKMYLLRKYPTNLCLAMRPKMETELIECRKEDKRQHWIFHKIRGGTD